MTNPKQTLDTCLWRLMANDPDSTTFKDVSEETSRDLWRCKYNCDGSDKGCLGYRPLKMYQHQEIYYKILDKHYENDESKLTRGLMGNYIDGGEL